MNSLLVFQREDSIFGRDGSSNLVVCGRRRRRDLTGRVRSVVGSDPAVWRWRLIHEHSAR